MTSPDAVMWLAPTETDHVVTLASSNGDYVTFALETVKKNPAVTNVEVADTPGSAYAPEVGTENDNNLSFHRYNVFLSDDVDEDEFIGNMAGELQTLFVHKDVDCEVSVRR